MRLNKKMGLCALTLPVSIAGCSSLEKTPVQTEHLSPPATWAAPSNYQQILDCEFFLSGMASSGTKNLQRYFQHFCLRE